VQLVAVEWALALVGHVPPALAQVEPPLELRWTTK
jgi:hypothetical protein